MKKEVLAAPKIIFKEMSLKDNIDLIKWAFFECGKELNIHSYTVGLFPELKGVSLNAPKEEVYKKIEEVVTKNYNDCKDSLKKEVQKYNKIWAPYNNKFFETLCKYLNISWPQNISVIEGSVGLIPVFPRYLDSFSFAIGTGIEEWKIIETCAHESLHFLWFEKWKQLFPKSKREEFESPHLVWKYSEMVVDPILNSKPFKAIFNINFKAYDSFYSLKYNGKPVMEELNKIYSKNDCVEEKIKTGSTFIGKVFNKDEKIL